ncbi:MAG: ATP-binding protein [Limisphaerales bacterium]
MLRFAAPKHTTFMTVHVHEVLDHALRLLQHQINGKMILLKKQYHAEPNIVRGDDAQLQQALMNLLLNALEAMGTNGVLTVATDIVDDDSGRQLRIQIQDSGMGIAPENLGRLFEPFFTTKKNGTGVGSCHFTAYRFGTSRLHQSAKRSQSRLHVQFLAADLRRIARKFYTLKSGLNSPRCPLSFSHASAFDDFAFIRFACGVFFCRAKVQRRTQLMPLLATSSKFCRCFST